MPLVILLMAAAWRICTVYLPAFSNFSPIMAIALCAGAYSKDYRVWAAPFLAMIASDLFINHHYASAYGYHMSGTETFLRLMCFAAALGIGKWISGRRSWLNLFSGTVGGSFLFYLVTNTSAWFGDPNYVHTAAGWWQALTVGHPQYEPTIFFFKNSLVSDLLFTGAFALAMACSPMGRNRTVLQKS